MTNANPTTLRLMRHAVVAAVCYRQLREMLDACTHDPSAIALRRILLDILCGTLIDYRWYVIRALRLVPAHPSVDDARAALLTWLEVGVVTVPDAETSRVAGRLASAHMVAVPAERLSKIARIVHVWLYRFVSVFGKAPTLTEIATSLAMRRSDLGPTLRELERAGFAINLGGSRGWMPTRAP